MTTPPDQPVSEPTVEQRHRDAAAVYGRSELWWREQLCTDVRDGKRDELPEVQAFARFERDYLTRPPVMDGEVDQIADTPGAGMIGESEGLRQLGLLYNYTEDDSRQFTRWQMLIAMEHGYTLATRPAPETTASDAVVDDWNPDPEDPFWMIEARPDYPNAGQWVKNLRTGLTTSEPAKALRFPSEWEADCARKRLYPKDCQFKVTEHLWANLPKPTEQATSPAPDAVLVEALRKITDKARSAGYASDHIACHTCADIADEIDAALASSKPTGCEGETWESINQWCDDTFGPATVEQIIDRAWEEWQELIAPDADHAVEAADVVICLCRIPGFADALQRKMTINRKRKWRLTGNGTGYHIPEPAIRSGDKAEGEEA